MSKYLAYFPPPLSYNLSKIWFCLHLKIVRHLQWPSTLLVRNYSIDTVMRKNKLTHFVDIRDQKNMYRNVFESRDLNRKTVDPVNEDGCYSLKFNQSWTYRLMETSFANSFRYAPLPPSSWSQQLNEVGEAVPAADEQTWTNKPNNFPVFRKWLACNEKIGHISG